MAKKHEQPKTSIDFTPEKINEITSGLFNFLNEKPENLFVNDYLILEQKLRFSDIEILIETNSEFKKALSDAKKIEETKLKKFAAADRLNATFVKEILNRDHNSY